MAHPRLCPFILIILSVTQGLCDEKYVIGISEAFVPCDSVDDQKLDTSMVELQHKEAEDGDEPSVMYMEGFMGLSTEIKSGWTIGVEIQKDTDKGSELMMSTSMEVCAAIKEDGAPWESVFEALGITSCPIKVGNYTVKDMQLKLGFAEDFMESKWCGSYTCCAKISDEMNNCMSCHTLSFYISRL